jgi:hypothetical protein
VTPSVGPHKQADTTIRRRIDQCSSGENIQRRGRAER